MTIEKTSNLITVKLGYNEHLVITNKYLCKIGYLSSQMNPFRTKPGYNEQSGRSQAVRYNQV